MTRRDEITAVSTQGDRPNWRPLLDAVGEDVTSWFMWMFEVATSDGRRIHAYKHIVTRRYVHLGEDGDAFYYVDRDRYRPIELPRLLEAVLAPWWEDDLRGGDHEGIAAAKRALARLPPFE